MQFNELLCLLVFLGAATVHGQEPEYTEIQLPGLCPKISYVSNLNGPRVFGWWYRSHTTFTSPLCYNGNEGQTMYTAPVDDTTLTLQYCCRSSADPSIPYCGEKVGTGTTVSTGYVGGFIYQFDDQTYLSHPIDTDYDNFAIVYGCKPESGEELIFIITRDYTLPARLLPRVNKILKRNGIAWSKLKPVKQGPTVPYIPNTGPRRNSLWSWLW